MRPPDFFTHSTENLMAGKLDGKTIAILATDGVEQVELLSPRDALIQAGARVEVISPEGGEIQGFDHLTPDKKINSDKSLGQVRAEDYDGLVLPGGVANPDQMRTEKSVQDFIRGFFDAGKPVGAICHAPWLLIDAGVVRGRKLTSYKTIRLDLKNAGAEVVDQEVVVDKGLVTSRSPDDLPAFNAKLIEEFGEGHHNDQARKAHESEQRFHA
jgi:protease I